MKLADLNIKKAKPGDKRALQSMGYSTKEEITVHGFRAMARTMLAERLRCPENVIEHQRVLNKRNRNHERQNSEKKNRFL